MLVDLEFKEHHAILKLNRPEALNALSFPLLRDVKKAVEEVDRSAARGLLIVGQGDKAFCAGADIKELMGRTTAEQKRDALAAQEVISSLGSLRVPSVAVINGFAFGGGLEVALACTFRLATPKARMGLPEIKLGLIPGYGGTQRLPRLIGEARALDMILSGRAIDAEEAYRIGLVNQIVDAVDPVGAGCSFLSQYSGFSIAASRLAREAVYRGLQGTVEDGLRIEADLLTQAFQTTDAQEGMQAFVEKRKPIIKDI